MRRDTQRITHKKRPHYTVAGADGERLVAAVLQYPHALAATVRVASEPSMGSVSRLREG